MSNLLIGIDRVGLTTPHYVLEATARARCLCLVAIAAAMVGLCVRAEPALARNTQTASFAQAKKHLEAIHGDHRVTLYSGCQFDAHKRVDYENCRYIPRRPAGRSQRIEWKHVVPAEAFGQGFLKWREGHAACHDSRGRPFRGRHCAAKLIFAYRKVEADMYNLVPEIGEVNARRSNLPMGFVTKGWVRLEGLDAKIGPGVFEPPRAAMGQIARTHLYMNAASRCGHGQHGPQRLEPLDCPLLEPAR